MQEPLVFFSHRRPQLSLEMLKFTQNSILLENIISSMSERNISPGINKRKRSHYWWEQMLPITKRRKKLVTNSKYRLQVNTTLQISNITEPGMTFKRFWKVRLVSCCLLLQFSFVFQLNEHTCNVSRKRNFVWVSNAQNKVTDKIIYSMTHQRVPRLKAVKAFAFYRAAEPNVSANASGFTRFAFSVSENNSMWAVCG